jgi:hypothetical protein
MEFPEYTAVMVLAPDSICDAVTGMLAAELVGPVGIRVCVASRLEPSM